MYHLRDDVAEKNDLAAEQPERLKTMLDAWKNWDGELAPPLWGTWTDKKTKEE